MLRDLRTGLRQLKHSPVFALTATLLLGIGIGANTLIFSVVDAILLRPLPIAHPENLVRLVEVNPNNFLTWTFPLELCQNFPAKANLTGIVCQGDIDTGFEHLGDIQRIRVEAVSPNFFTTLNLIPAQGRPLLPEDDRAGAMNAVVSYNFWSARLAPSGFSVGQTITLNGRSFNVVGILPRGINGLEVDTSPDVRVPIKAARLLLNQPEFDVGFQIFGRLRPDITIEQADAQAEPSLRAAYDDAEAQARPRAPRRPASQAPDSRLSFEPAGHGVSSLRSQFSRGLIVLMACVALLLLMACANVACLLLARAAARSPEMTIRLALGATPWRLARQLLTESVVLALAGGAAGIAIAYTCMPLLLAALPPIRDRAAVVQPLAVNIAVNPRVLAFALLASLLTAVLFGLSPALQSVRLDLASALRATRASTARLSARSALVAAQIAICVLLMAEASLLVSTFTHMRSMNPGFDADHIVTFTIDPTLRGYTPEKARLMSRQLLEKAQTLPGVMGAAIASRGLMRGTGIKVTVRVPGKPSGPAESLNTSLNTVTPGYFETMGMRVEAGSDFRWTDPRITKPPIHAIVNQAFARHFFPGENAVGKIFGGLGPGGAFQATGQIAGVVSDAKYRSLREEIPPTEYTEALDGFPGAFVLHLRTRARPAELIAPVRQLLRSLDPQLPIVETATLREGVETSLWQERLLADFSGIFAAIAALLAGIGLYGALDLAVKSRTREIGVRVALGADALRVIKLLASEVMLLVVCGTGAGLALFATSNLWLGSVLYGVSAADPIAPASTLTLIALITLIATAIPAWRAITIDPATALRHE